MRVRELAACLLLAALCVSQTASAEATAPDASAAPASPPLPLSLSLGDSKLDAEAVRRAVELELKRPVALTKTDPNSVHAADGAAQSLSVVVRADHTVTVSYHAANGVTRTRAIGLPQDPKRGPEVIALLSGNLSRDEAAELLAGLAARANTPTNDGAAPPAEPAAEAPKKAEPPAPALATKPAIIARKTRTQRATDDLLRAPYPVLDLTLWHPIGLVPSSQRYVINGELGLVWSHVGALEGVGLNLMLLRTERDVHGWSYATVYNRTGGDVYGVTGAGLVAQYRDLQGCAISGIANVGRDSRACAIAGISNRARDGRGVQVAGIVNIAGKYQGVQLSGITNIADEIAGVQIGVVNVAGNVRGLQLGVVNVAKRVDGASLGLVSIAGNGRVQPVLWASTFMPLHAAAKFTVGSFYTQLGGGYQPSNHTYTYELGLGLHLPIGRFFIEPGVHYSEQRNTTRPFTNQLNEHVHYRVAAGWDLRAISPFVGAAVRQRFAHSASAPDSSVVTVEGFAGLAFF